MALRLSHILILHLMFEVSTLSYVHGVVDRRVLLLSLMLRGRGWLIRVGRHHPRPGRSVVVLLGEARRRARTLRRAPLELEHVARRWVGGNGAERAHQRRRGTGQVGVLRRGRQGGRVLALLRVGGGRVVVRRLPLGLRVVVGALRRVAAVVGTRSSPHLLGRGGRVGGVDDGRPPLRRRQRTAGGGEVARWGRLRVGQHVIARRVAGGVDVGGAVGVLDVTVVVRRHGGVVGVLLQHWHLAVRPDGDGRLRAPARWVSLRRWQNRRRRARRRALWRVGPRHVTAHPGGVGQRWGLQLQLDLLNDLGGWAEARFDAPHWRSPTESVVVLVVFLGHTVALFEPLHATMPSFHEHSQLLLLLLNGRQDVRGLLVLMQVGWTDALAGKNLVDVVQTVDCAVRGNGGVDGSGSAAIWRRLSLADLELLSWRSDFDGTPRRIYHQPAAGVVLHHLQRLLEVFARLWVAALASHQSVVAHLVVWRLGASAWLVVDVAGQLLDPLHQRVLLLVWHWTTSAGGRHRIRIPQQTPPQRVALDGPPDAGRRASGQLVVAIASPTTDAGRLEFSAVVADRVVCDAEQPLLGFGVWEQLPHSRIRGQIVRVQQNRTQSKSQIELFLLLDRWLLLTRFLDDHNPSVSLVLVQVQVFFGAVLVLLGEAHRAPHQRRRLALVTGRRAGSVDAARVAAVLPQFAALEDTAELRLLLVAAGLAHYPPLCHRRQRDRLDDVALLLLVLRRARRTRRALLADGTLAAVLVLRLAARLGFCNKKGGTLDYLSLVWEAEINEI